MEITVLQREGRYGSDIRKQGKRIGMKHNKHRTWAEIDLNIIEHNFKTIQEHVGDCPIMAIIKQMLTDMEVYLWQNVWQKHSGAVRSSNGAGSR